MNSFEEAFKNAGLNFEKTEGEVITEEDERKYKTDMDIKMLEEHLKLIKRNANEKELYHFATKYGFLSYQHYSMWLNYVNHAQEEREEAELNYENYDDCEYLKQVNDKYEEEIKEADRFRDIWYYKFVMRQIGGKDYSPYGKNLLKRSKNEIDNIIFGKPKEWIFE